MVAASSETSLPIVIAISLFVIVLAASCWDGFQRRIPNVLSLGGVLLGIAVHTLASGLDGLLVALAGCGVGFAFLIPGYVLGKTGAGDVKLLAAVGSFVGPHSAVIAAVATILTGAIIALVVALFARGENPWRRYQSMFHYLWITRQWTYEAPPRREAMAATFPYAFAIAAGAIAGYWHYLLHVHPAAGLA